MDDLTGRSPSPRTKAANEATVAAGVATNAHGGVKVSDEELRAAFQFFDVDNTGKVTISNLKVWLVCKQAQR